MACTSVGMYGRVVYINKEKAMITNEIHQIGRIYQMERLSDAAMHRKQRRRNVAENRAHPSLAERMGDWFIGIGMKLKAQQGAPTMGTPLAQR